MLKKIGKFLFTNRSYTPIPFFFISIFFINPTYKSIIIGLILVVLGEIIRIWAVSYAGSETRATAEVTGSVLVTQGPFAIIRNPLYQANIIIYTGIGLMTNSLFPYLQIIGIVYFLFQYYCIILVEEDYLEKQFGESYLEYKKNVGRFIFLFKKVPLKIKSNIKFDLKKGLQSESKTLLAIAFITFIILIIFILEIRIFKV
ncbi:MAG: isoprenylcysteine carboxylmethyltransferase family protein [Ignavibacteria bacterium]|nr:isoprenylcysteine carboxylmethyltransferase family protein [Ignavibacteria bacterium]